MSRIANAKGRNTKRDGESGYTRVIGNIELGQLLSKVQATVISNGTELEKIITSKCQNIDNIDTFIEEAEKNEIDNGTFVCVKKILKKTKNYAEAIKGIEPDMLIFIVSNHRVCKVIELKDGDTFDTKKVKGEKENLISFTEKFGAKIPFSTDYYICSFNQNNKDAIINGMKGAFDIEHILTGKELCQILSIDYDAIVNGRKKDMDANFEYFIDELLKIDVVKNALAKKINLKI